MYVYLFKICLYIYIFLFSFIYLFLLLSFCLFSFIFFLRVICNSYQLAMRLVFTFLPKCLTGNEFVAALTAAAPYILRVDLTDWENNTAYAEYSNFVLGGAETNYTILSLGTYSGTAGILWSQWRSEKTAGMRSASNLFIYTHSLNLLILQEHLIRTIILDQAWNFLDKNLIV